MQRMLLAGTILVLSSACTELDQPTAVEVPGIDLHAARVVGGLGGMMQVNMTDDCEPISFNEVLGPGGCVGKGKTTFEEMIAELVATGDVKKFRFIPERRVMQHGQALAVLNTGGEPHTYTPVAEYGGGFVEDLNEIMGLVGIVPECMPPHVFAGIVAAGDVQILETTGSEAALHAGTQKVMCCIHPWMRGTVEVK